VWTLAQSSRERKPAKIVALAEAVIAWASNSSDESGDFEMEAVCTHLDQVREVTPGAEGCEECLRTGDEWVHLRLCETCGHVGCCDSSPNKHATKHFQASKHPIIKSFEPGEEWGYCYVDSLFLERL
jgi:uncharacterized UBP type Zn finger protein